MSKNSTIEAPVSVEARDVNGFLINVGDEVSDIQSGFQNFKVYEIRDNGFGIAEVGVRPIFQLNRKTEWRPADRLIKGKSATN